MTGHSRIHRKGRKRLRRCQVCGVHPEHVRWWDSHLGRVMAIECPTVGEHGWYFINANGYFDLRLTP